MTKLNCLAIPDTYEQKMLPAAFALPDLLSSEASLWCRAVKESVPLVIQDCARSWSAKFLLGLERTAADPSLGDASVRVSCAESPRFSGMVARAEHVAMSWRLFWSHVKQHGKEGDPLLNSGQHYYLSQLLINRRGSSSTPLAEHLFFEGMLPTWAFSAAEYSETNVWIGAGETMSTTHYDAENNLLCCVAGRKRAILVSPNHLAEIGAEPLSGESHHHASHDLLHGQLEADPVYRSRIVLTRVRGKDDRTGGGETWIPALCVDLLPGDALFIPEGWWHAVFSAPGTIAINFWWAGMRAVICREPQATYLARSLLHSLCEASLSRSRMLAVDGAMLRLVQQIEQTPPLQLEPSMSSGGPQSPTMTSDWSQLYSCAATEILRAVQVTMGDWDGDGASCIYGPAVQIALRERTLPGTTTSDDTAATARHAVPYSEGIVAALRWLEKQSASSIAHASPPTFESAGTSSSDSPLISRGIASASINDVFLAMPSRLCFRVLGRLLARGMSSVARYCFLSLTDTALDSLAARWDADGAADIQFSLAEFPTHTDRAGGTSAGAGRDDMIAHSTTSSESVGEFFTALWSAVNADSTRAVTAVNTDDAGITTAAVGARDDDSMLLFPRRLQCASEALRQQCLVSVLSEITSSNVQIAQPHGVAVRDSMTDY